MVTAQPITDEEIEILERFGFIDHDFTDPDTETHGDCHDCGATFYRFSTIKTDGETGNKYCRKCSFLKNNPSYRKFE